MLGGDPCYLGRGQRRTVSASPTGAASSRDPTRETGAANRARISVVLQGHPWRKSRDLPSPHGAYLLPGKDRMASKLPGRSDRSGEHDQHRSL
jgi:hypothetical protein